MSEFWKGVEDFWNDSRILAWILGLFGLGGALWATLNPQSPGVSIGLLALAAGIMSIRPKMHTAEKTAWVLTLITFAVLEVMAIKRSDRENVAKQVEQNAKFHDIAGELSKAISLSRDQFKTTMDAFSDEQGTRQRQFDTTMRQFSARSAEENVRFKALVDQDQRLFDHEEKLSESTGGVLVPGSDPTPKSPWCLPTNHPDAFSLILGSSAVFVASFPHVAIYSQSRGPVVTLVRANDGNIAVIMDIRDSTGRIVARLGENGYLIGSRLSIEKPNKSTLVVFDEFGVEALHVRYLNPHVMSMSGYMNLAQGPPITMQVPGMADSCIGGFGREIVVP